MRDRLGALDGRLTVSSSPDHGGTVVSGSIPLRPAGAATGAVGIEDVARDEASDDTATA